MTQYSGDISERWIEETPYAFSGLKMLCIEGLVTAKARCFGRIDGLMESLLVEKIICLGEQEELVAGVSVNSGSVDKWVWKYDPTTGHRIAYKKLWKCSGPSKFVIHGWRVLLNRINADSILCVFCGWTLKAHSRRLAVDHFMQHGGNRLVSLWVYLMQIFAMFICSDWVF
ncbi:hypothetical protein L195_g034938 [Trifolium pratense]|uniref:Uncharacterized protein n=1 Tax=Trifolium pratense TaxID=57577 RepID=A0A2K3LK97_TRIPR|nr:hypothetical protein L195_g034938 [Trifolium pratense]